MANNRKYNPNNSFWAGNYSKDTMLHLNYIIRRVKIETGKSLLELKMSFDEERLFNTVLQFVTTTKKAVCEAFSIPVENACRYKRKLELEGLLVESFFQASCPVTNNPAKLLSTNRDEFERLLLNPLKCIGSNGDAN
jgi:hypothetical protein